MTPCLVVGLSAAACSDNGAATESAASDGDTSTSGTMTGPTTSSTSMSTTTTTTTVTSTSVTGTDSSEDSFGTTNASAPTTGMTTDAGVPAKCVGMVVGNPDCGGDTPYCVDTVCVGCVELSSCADVDPERPACEPTSGLCVECITSDDCLNIDDPVCDVATATCGPCTEHAQCPDRACNLESGQCFPYDSVLYVYNDIDICSDKAEYGFTQFMPLCTLAAALKRASVGEPLTVKVRHAAKHQTLPAGLPVGAYVVAIVPQNFQEPTLIKSGDAPAVTVSAGNTVFMWQLRIAGAGVGGPTLLCSGASLWLDQLSLGNAETALEASDCSVHLRRTVVYGSTGGGLAVGGKDPAKAQLWLENSFLTENNGETFGGLRLAEAASAKIVYSTIALNKSVASPIDCAPGWTGKLELNNSALVDSSPMFGAGCGKPVVTHSHQSMVGDEDMLQKTTFAGISGGVYKALAGGLLKDVALNSPGSPKIDFDGTPRPPGPDYAGADRPPM